MNKRSASTLIYFHDKTSRKNTAKRPTHVNREKRAKKIFLTGKAILICAVITSVTWAYLKYKPLNVSEVRITGAERFVSNKDMMGIVDGRVLGENILFLNKDELEKVVLTNFLAAKDVSVKKQFPRLLKIEIVERTPIALILPKNTNKFYFVDADGFLLGLADKSSTNLPIINYAEDIEVGKFIEPGTVNYYFDLIKALDEDGIFVSTISSYPRYTEFYTNDQIQVLFANTQDPKPQSKIFTKMMESFKTEGKKVKKIDLRFDKVIVEFIN